MKKKIILFITIGVLLVTLICIPKSTYQKLFSENPVEEPIEETREFLRVYVVDDNNKIVGINVYVDELEEDVVIQKWNILTSNMNLLPSGYSSPITPSTVLNNYTIEDDKMILNVSEEIKRSSGRLTIESLAWNFCNDEIKEVILKVDDEVVTSINDCNFTKITKSIGVNYQYETSYLFEADNITIVYYQDDIIMPVTYFYKDNNQYDYMISKIFSENNLETVGYTYEIKDDMINIVIEDEIVLNDNVKQTIIETTKLNLELDSITVANNSSTLIEQTFFEISSNE